ncbi:MAG: intradiol ring-cleavage dioxygenase [Candidatus Scalinduaceae bacterium]
MIRLSVLYLVLCFLFLNFSGFGGTYIEKLQLGTKLAQAEDLTKQIQTSRNGPCKPTPRDILGPFYVPNAPERTSVGKGHVLSGVVRSSVDCSPIAGTRIEFWLVGPHGRYDDDHRATLFSDKMGEYKFESNFPPSYARRPSHIHIKVTAKGYRTLTTQYYPVKGQTEGKFDLVLIPED